MSKEFTIFKPPRESLFRVKTIEHKEMWYEVWARDSSEAIKNLKRGQGFGTEIAFERDILETEIIESD